MSINDEIAAKQQEINKLQLEQSVLREGLLQDRVDEIKKLDWIRGRTAVFDYNIYYAAGIFTWQFRIAYHDEFLDKGFDSHNRYIILKDDKEYNRSVVLYKDYNNHAFNQRTSDYRIMSYNSEAMVQFFVENDVKVDMNNSGLETFYRYVLNGV